MAPSAKQHALGEMVMNAVALATAASQIHNLLHLLKELLADDRVVPPGEDVALVGDIAAVVRVFEHLVELALRYWLFRRTCRCP
ncbi:hypothetical protein [Arthrobacter sp. 35W]|uniref:hypothetical protein n=1 Tax=Arthrobacter sp. 35W TaxID=1132441 RepID=UPI001E550284|nr:hypothetical protein [Arthrobacter sp. 35W]